MRVLGGAWIYCADYGRTGDEAGQNIGTFTVTQRADQGENEKVEVKARQKVFFIKC